MGEPTRKEASHGAVVYRQLQCLVDAEVQRLGALEVLDAGCGRETRLEFGEGARLVGIDASPRQLDHHGLLADRIEGDVQDYPLPENRFDIVVSWDVIEHLPRPEDAIERFATTTKPGGLVILACPNLLSFKGLVTRFTPYAVHVAFYRHILGDASAGTEDTAQFPTYLRYAIAPHRLRGLFTERGFTEELFRIYEGPVLDRLRGRSRLAGAALDGVGWLSRGLSLGRWNANHSDLVLVCRKPGAAQGGGQ